MVEQLKNLFGRQRILILTLNAGHFARNAPMHILGRLLVNVAITVFHGVFVHPHTGSELVAAKISQRGSKSLFVRVCFLFHAIFR